MCLLNQTVFPGERCGPWASCFKEASFVPSAVIFYGFYNVKDNKNQKTNCWNDHIKVTYCYFHCLYLNTQLLHLCL